MSWLPGWNSIDTTRSIHDFCELWGIILFLVVVVLEFGAYFYGHRSEDLSTIAESNAAQVRQRDQAETNQRHAAEISDVQARANTARQEVEELRHQQANRHLTEDQKTDLIQLLMPFHGERVSVICILGDVEGKALAEDFVGVFAQAGWDYGGGTGVAQANYDTDPVGILVTIHSSEAKTPQEPRSAIIIARALYTAHVVPIFAVYSDPSAKIGYTELRIGRKPPK